MIVLCKDRFGKFKKSKNNKYLNEIISSSGELNIKFLIIPLVDKGSIEDKKQEKNLLDICKMLEKKLIENKVKIIFGLTFNPKKLSKFIKKFNYKYFGINYDTGNSASLDYDIDKEFKNYGKYIYNIHIKDRLKFGKNCKVRPGKCKF